MVVCKELGYPSGKAIFVNVAGISPFQTGQGPYIIHKIHCLGNESSIEFCPNNGWGVDGNCMLNEHAMVNCDGPVNRTTKKTTTAKSTTARTITPKTSQKTSTVATKTHQCEKISVTNDVLDKIGRLQKSLDEMRRDFLPQGPYYRKCSSQGNCLSLKRAGRPTGIYWVYLGGACVQLYCDMTTDGGGWTKVWGYTFMDYTHFNKAGNAVIPVPTWPRWPVSSNHVPTSTTPPLGDGGLGAICFDLWKTIGSEMLVKSNINNWLVCKEAGGSLVRWVPGGVRCRIVKNITSKCLHVRPHNLVLNPRGPSLGAISAYYYYDGTLDGNWPTHDPCGLNKPNQREDVPDPNGAIYIR